MSIPELRKPEQYTEEWIKRFRRYTDQVTWFGRNSVARAWAGATAGLAYNSHLLYTALLRRFTLLSASDDVATEVAAERGAERFGAQRAKMLVIFTPTSANVQAITSAGTDKIEVDDSAGFTATNSIRIRNGAGTVTETATIIAVTSGTGPGGGDEIEVATLSGTYAPSTDDVDILLRKTIPIGSTLSTSAGVNFETLASVTTGDANAVLDGESSSLSLADKVWAEAVVAGASGNVDALSAEDLAPSVAGLLSVSNPERATGGADTETDFDLKYRAVHGPSGLSQETRSWLESIAKLGNIDVLRVVQVASTVSGQMEAKVLHRSGNVFTTAALDALELYIGQRSRSHMTVSLQNITLTAVEVEAQITIDTDTTLEAVWKSASGRLADYLDYRKWDFGADVDEAKLLSLLVDTPGVSSVDTAAFLPAANVVVAADSLPHLVRLSLLDTATATTVNASLSQSF